MPLIKQIMSIGDALRVRVRPSERKRIAAVKRLGERFGLAHRDHFRMMSGKFTVRKLSGGKINRLAEKLGVSREVILGDPDLRLQCVDLVRVVDNLIVTAGINFMVDAFQGSVEPEDMKYHAVGTGTTGPVVGNTTLETETLLGNAQRPTGSQTENGADTYQTVATTTCNVAGPIAITESGILSADVAGTLLCRQTFGAINLSQDDAIETTWEITVS